MREGHNPARLASWGEAQLHLLVAHFVAARFPILLALNKVGGGKLMASTACSVGVGVGVVIDFNVLHPAA